ncbi:hypothetical protein FRC07_003507, partial [Ceratobasidium sp. 392]
ALGEEPYLMRFPGGWISEEIMKQQLRNKRDTKTRAGKQASAQKISKPMQLLVQKTPAESRARTATVNNTLRTTTANTPRVRPADNQDSDEDDERWGDQIDAELKGLGRKAQQSQGNQSAGASAGLSTRQAAATSSRANPPAKSTIRPRMRPPPASDSDSKSESELESEPEATPPSAKGKEPAMGSKKAKGTNNARSTSTNTLAPIREQHVPIHRAQDMAQYTLEQTLYGFTFISTASEPSDVDEEIAQTPNSGDDQTGDNVHPQPAVGNAEEVGNNQEEEVDQNRGERKCFIARL